MENKTTGIYSFERLLTRCLQKEQGNALASFKLFGWGMHWYHDYQLVTCQNMSIMSMVDRCCIDRCGFISLFIDIARYMGSMGDFIAIISFHVCKKWVSNFQSIPMFGLTANIVSGSPCKESTLSSWRSRNSCIVVWTARKRINH